MFGMHSQLIKQCSENKRVDLVGSFVFMSPAGVQPQLIQGIRRRDSVGEDQETTA